MFTASVGVRGSGLDIVGVSGVGVDPGEGPYPSPSCAYEWPKEAGLDFLVFPLQFLKFNERGWQFRQSSGCMLFCLRPGRPPRNPTTSFLTAATLIYAIGAGITAAAGTTLLRDLDCTHFNCQTTIARYCYLLSLPPRVRID